MSIAIWDFSAVCGKVNRIYLKQLELTLTFSVSPARKARSEMIGSAIDQIC
jgi:hypothetical protein